jgi:hypothetical protein
MIKRLVSSIFITSCLWVVANLSPVSQPSQERIQVKSDSNQFYTLSGQENRPNFRISTRE